MSRKPRKVKDCLVDKHDISCEAGPNFINWTYFAKIKLKQRETQSFKRKLQLILQTVDKQLHEFSNQYNIDFTTNSTGNGQQQDALFIIHQQQIEEWIKHLLDPIAKWEGILSYRSRASITKFSQYFDKSKNWFDQTKMKIYTQTIFPDIFQLIYDFAYHALIHNNNNNNNNIYFDLCLICILKHIFDTKISYPSTRDLSLIPAGCLKFNKDMNTLHEFLYHKVNKEFNVDFWKNNEMYKNQRAGILNKTRNKLAELANDTQKLLISTLSISINSTFTSTTTSQQLSIPAIPLNPPSTGLLPQLSTLQMVPINGMPLQSTQILYHPLPQNQAPNQAQRQIICSQQNQISEAQQISTDIVIKPYPMTPNLTAYSIQCTSTNFSTQIIIDHGINNIHNNNNNNNTHHHISAAAYNPSHSSFTSSNCRWSPLIHRQVSNPL